MCGDGANDCGALKAASVGIGICQQEACIAAAFSSEKEEMNCVIDLLREGRAALAAQLSSFKFFTLYALI